MDLNIEKLSFLLKPKWILLISNDGNSLGCGSKYKKYWMVFYSKNDAIKYVTDYIKLIDPDYSDEIKDDLNHDADEIMDDDILHNFREDDRIKFIRFQFIKTDNDISLEEIYGKADAFKTSA